MPDQRVVRCPDCLSTFDEDTVMDETDCPKCASQRMPEYVDQDVTITVNWDNLRLLANWAHNWGTENFEEDSLEFLELEAVLKKLRPHRPVEADHLTLRDAVTELQLLGVLSPDLEISDDESEPEKGTKVELVEKPVKTKITRGGSSGGGYLN